MPTEAEWQQQIVTVARVVGWTVLWTRDSRKAPPGEPDLRFVWSQWDNDWRPPCQVLAIELKVRDGAGRARHRTDEQRRFATQAALAGECVVEVLLPDDLDLLSGMLGISLVEPGEEEAATEERQRFDLDSATDGELASELLRLGVSGQTVDSAMEHGQVARRRAMVALYHQALNSKRGG